MVDCNPQAPYQGDQKVKPLISLIAAVANNGVIGDDATLVNHSALDLAMFTYRNIRQYNGTLYVRVGIDSDIGEQ